MLFAGKVSRGAFKAYDIRGRVPEEINETLAYRIGLAYVELFNVKTVVLGHDVRPSSAALSEALARGLREGGCDLIDIGLCGTEQVYFAAFHLGLDGGIMVTASHNPRDYNGMKLVRSGAIPISGDSGLRELEERVVKGCFAPLDLPEGTTIQRDITGDYIRHLLSYVDRSAFRSLKVVVNAGNGCAGPVIDALEDYFTFSFCKDPSRTGRRFSQRRPKPAFT